MSITNLYRALRDLLPEAPLQVGTVAAVHDDGTATVTLPGGGQLRLRGTAAASDRVYIKDGKIDGPAPDLPFVEIEE